MAGRLQVIPPGVLYFRIQSGRTRKQYYLCVCVYIYYIANEQIAAMWHGLVAWLVKKRNAHADSHTPRTYTPVPSHSPPPPFHHNTHTCTHTHTPNHKAPSVLGLSAHQLMRSAGLGVLIITLLSGGLTNAHSLTHIHAHTLSCTQFSQQRETAQYRKG